MAVMMQMKTGRQITDYASLTLSNRAFSQIQHYIQSEVGIKLPPVKKTMLQARLQKRLRQLQLTSFDEYCDYVFSDQGHTEVVHMIDVITTNKTDFFREPAHFDHLTGTVLPELLASGMLDRQNPLSVWSAGCSTGEEPYTLAMILSESAELRASSDFRILATDISTRVLRHAETAVYSEEKSQPVPMHFKKKYLLRSKSREKKEVRFVPAIRQKVRFQRVNFMDDDFNVRQRFHVIFCRNVIIYFDRDTQQRMVGKLLQHLIPGGFLYLGHSETLHGLDLPVRSVAPTVYRKMPVRMNQA